MWPKDASLLIIIPNLLSPANQIRESRSLIGIRNGWPLGCFIELCIVQSGEAPRLVGRSGKERTLVIVLRHAEGCTS